jgi:hypothetical protein
VGLNPYYDWMLGAIIMACYGPSREKESDHPRPGLAKTADESELPFELDFRVRRMSHSVLVSKLSCRIS